MTDQPVGQPHPDIPVLDLKPTQVICSLHGEPLRAKWPHGYAAFCIIGFRKVLDVPEVLKASGGEISKVPAMLEVTPICCRLGSTGLLEVYREVQATGGPWVMAYCEFCHKHGLGGSFEATNYWRRKIKFKHVCLECVCFKMGGRLDRN